MNENQKSPKDTARTEVSLWGIAGLLLRKIHWLIVAGLVLGVGVYLVLSLLVTPTYESRVTFYVYNNSGGASSSGSIDKSDLQAAESLATTYSKILEQYQMSSSSSHRGALFLWLVSIGVALCHLRLKPRRRQLPKDFRRFLGGVVLVEAC